MTIALHGHSSPATRFALVGMNGLMQLRLTRQNSALLVRTLTWVTSPPGRGSPASIRSLGGTASLPKTSVHSVITARSETHRSTLFARCRISGVNTILLRSRVVVESRKRYNHSGNTGAREKEDPNAHEGEMSPSTAIALIGFTGSLGFASWKVYTATSDAEKRVS